MLGVGRGNNIVTLSKLIHENRITLWSTKLFTLEALDAVH